jgi:hypothetical protein
MNNKNKSFASMINKLIATDAGKQSRATKTQEKFAKAYFQGIEKLDDDQKILAFKNVITWDGTCGFANGGTIQYLLNTDTGRGYRVTVRTFWSQGVNSGQYDNVYMTTPGGRTLLGCTDSGYIPVTSYIRQVVGEEPK